ncbi:PREDICTED: killer cell lectin-like receptor subfamily G member 2 [Chrysochloris asiatica]|uniref:Killer cell lectin-like receptor subfamily G member 2 n=1 Tax=Chrysochloris asiatica TaxID=185453 RepID=A0A9B0TC25_CHRAS|nr:PREDICTED: killer cell lectin-like receptor subfamily G member 2 [Chrysochloris asiatica]
MSHPEFPMEPLDGGTPGPGSGSDLSEEVQRPRSPQLSPDPAGGERRRPAPLRLPGLGYGAFRRPGASEPPVPADPPLNGDAPGSEAGAWAPVELQVDVRVTPVGTPGRTPSPAPSRRFLTVPVPESPGIARRSSPLLSAPPSPLASPADGILTPFLGRCRCRELGPDKKEDAALLPSADGKELPRAIALMGLPMYMRSLRWALAIMALLLAVCVVTIVVLVSRVGAKCRPCPRDWMWTQELCFYLSPEALAWEASQAFCSAHRASLPLLNHTQSFLSRHHMALRSWVGVQHDPQGWRWTDGAPLPPQLLPEETEGLPELRCGALEEGRLVALDCTTPRPWICVRPLE